MKVKRKRVKQYPFDQFEIPNDPDRRKDAFDDLLSRYIRNNPDIELGKFRDNTDNTVRIVGIKTDENGNQVMTPISFKEICNAEKTCISKPIVTDVTYAAIPDEWIAEYLENCERVPEVYPAEETNTCPIFGFIAEIFLIAIAALIEKSASIKGAGAE